jgi:anaerobic selenocysteine-containing dehydrogenase
MKRRRAFDWSWVPTVPPPRTFLEPLLGEQVLAAADPAVRMMWISCANPVAMLPDSRTVARALETREMTVVVDAFLTDTARAAHLVLPTTTMLEDDDLVGAYGHHWLNEVRPVVPPPQGVRSDLRIIQGLAERVGLAHLFDGEPETFKRRVLAGVAERGASLEALRRGPVRNPVAERVLFEGRRFPTPTGRVQLAHDLDPTPIATTRSGRCSSPPSPPRRPSPRSGRTRPGTARPRRRCTPRRPRGARTGRWCTWNRRWARFR